MRTNDQSLAAWVIYDTQLDYLGSPAPLRALVELARVVVVVVVIWVFHTALAHTQHIIMVSMQSGE